MTKKLVISIIFCAFLFLNGIISQDLLSGMVVDAQSGDPIPYASVQIRNSDYGTITSEEGLYKLKRLSEESYLNISCTGYESTELEIKDSFSPIIKLNPAAGNSKAINKYDPYNLLYKSIINARKQKEDLKAQTAISLKTYSGSGLPIEVLEAFYQSQYSISKGIESLRLKNGRFGIISMNAMLINSLEATKTLSRIDLFHYSDKLDFPISPLSLNKLFLKQFFNVEIREIYNNNDDLIAILEFEPIQSTDEYLKGTIFLDINNKRIKKVVLRSIDVKQHPFSPFNEEEKISDIEFEITFNFRETKEVYQAYDYINLKYSYKRSDNTAISTSATLVFQDYKKEYTPIICDLNSITTDYDMIMALPYNNEFWASNDAMIVNNDLEKYADHFAKNGIIVNCSSNEEIRNNAENSIVVWKKDSHLQWSDINKDQNIQFQQDKYLNNKSDDFNKDYFLDINIVLDCNWMDDTLKGCCHTVFNKSTSFFKAQQSSHALDFINLQFDLAETVKRQLKQTLMKRHEQIDNINELQDIYNDYMARLKNTQKQMADEVQYGNNENNMKEWRERIDNELYK